MKKLDSTKQRAARTRSRIRGTSERPRLSVNISNLHISAQIINDETGKTLAMATTIGSKEKGTMTEKASTVGKQIGAAAKEHKIKRLAFDRGAKKYHGRLSALADAVRAEGLEM
jgi:large subunit ribosomal protein L18